MDGKEEKKRQAALALQGSKTTAPENNLESNTAFPPEHQLFLSAYNAPRPGTALFAREHDTPQSSPQLC